MTAVPFARGAPPEAAPAPGPWPDLLEEHLDRVLPEAAAPPQALHAAMRHAVFPGGKRVRPRLLLAVAAACGADHRDMELALRAACAVELLHSAALLQDDLPCFDQRAVRRGRPAVHARFGEPLAILAGQALTTRAFEIMSEGPPATALRALRIVRLLGHATGSREGLLGGHAPELPPAEGALGWVGLDADPVARYHALRTTALCRLAAEAGALAAGRGDGGAWAQAGHCFGLAYVLGEEPADRGSLRALFALFDSCRRSFTTLAGEPEPLLALLRETRGPVR
jgi:geranylgeranyl diphosphate synthase, type II